MERARGDVSTLPAFLLLPRGFSLLMADHPKTCVAIEFAGLRPRSPSAMSCWNEVPTFELAGAEPALFSSRGCSTARCAAVELQRKLRVLLTFPRSTACVREVDPGSKTGRFTTLSSISRQSRVRPWGGNVPTQSNNPCEGTSRAADVRAQIGWTRNIKTCTVEHERHGARLPH